MNKDLYDTIRNARIPQNSAFKTSLKEQLILRAERAQTSFMKTFLKLSLTFTVLAVVLSQVVLPGDSVSTLSRFIQEAQAANEDHMDEIYHAHIQIEDSIYLETDDFTGWQTLSKVQKELWLAPNDDLREEINFTNWNGPNESGVFDEVHNSDSSLAIHDEYGNVLSYTKLEVIDTAPVEIDGEIVGEDIFNVHPGKQHSTDELKSAFEDEYICVNTEPGTDFTGYAWATLKASDPSFLEISATNVSSQEPNRIMQELEKLQNEGHASTDELIELFEEIQDDPRITYEETEENGLLLHHISFNQTDFLGGSFSNSKEALENLVPETVWVTYTFIDYELSSITSERSINGQVTQRSSMQVLDAEYLDYASNHELFEPTEEYTALSMMTPFEQNISDFQPGCYHRGERLDAKEDAWFTALAEKLNEEGNEGSKALWEHPLLSNFLYYTLPGDLNIYEVK